MRIKKKLELIRPLQLLGISNEVLLTKGVTVVGIMSYPVQKCDRMYQIIYMQPYTFRMLGAILAGMTTS
jgi:hypothetical protein